MENNPENTLYPTLPDYPTLPGYPILPVPERIIDTTNFRLQEIKDIKIFLEKEIEYRKDVHKKYKKAFNIITNISHGLAFVGAGAGAVSLTTVANLLTAPVGFALGGVAIGSSVITFGLNFYKKKIVTKMEKHETIVTLAVSKLNTINDLVSKALTDSHISQEEFTLILREREKYIGLKNSVRKKIKENSSNSSDPDLEALKKTFLEEGKKLAESEMLAKLTK